MRTSIFVLLASCSWNPLASDTATTEADEKDVIAGNCATDFNHDGIVNILDWGMFVQAYSPQQSCYQRTLGGAVSHCADLNHSNGKPDVLDIGMFANMLDHTVSTGDCNLDLDGDGMSAYAEARYGTVDSDTDTDGDTWPDDVEVDLETDPLDGQHMPEDDDGGTSADYGLSDPDGDGIYGNRISADWRPFDSSSPWNTPIPAGTAVHDDSSSIMSQLKSAAPNIRFTNSYLPPIWFVDSTKMDHVIVRSDKIYDDWDTDDDGWSDVGVPVTEDMWGEPTEDGHISIIDIDAGIAWEMSHYKWIDGVPNSTTFNLWELDGPGWDTPPEGATFQLRGGRGSGFPIVAGLVRPEEVLSGEIRHPLVFTVEKVAVASDGDDLFVSPPACRNDGDYVGSQYPLEGMLFQLDPSLDDADFESWGLTDEAKVVARALQTYGMYLGDKGGNMALQVQLLGPTSGDNRDAWDDLAPGFYDSVQDIPTSAFRVLETGEVVERN